MKNQVKQPISIKALNEKEMKQVTGGEADFSDVTVTVSSTAEMWSSEPRCFGNPYGKDFFCYYVRL